MPVALFLHRDYTIIPRLQMFSPLKFEYYINVIAVSSFLREHVFGNNFLLLVYQSLEKNLIAVKIC